MWLAGHAAAFIGDVMYVFGGESETGLLGELYELSINANPPQWSLSTATGSAGLAPEARFGHRLLSNGLFLYVVGGKGSVKHLMDVWRFDTVARSWTVVAPYDGK